MPLVLAVSAALLLGASDLFAARSAGTTPSVTVTRTAVLTSVVLSPLLLLFVDSRWSASGVGFGALSGVCMIVGLMLLYQGYAIAPMGIVAPLSSVLLAAVPVMWDIAAGNSPSGVSAGGMALGVVAIVLTSYRPGGEGSVVTGAVLGISSGVAFGSAFTFMGQIDSAAGLTPVIAQRIAGLALLLLVWRLRSDPFVAGGTARRWAALAGALGLVAIGCLQVAYQHGSLGPVSVASSQFATAAVILSVIVNHERMRWWQAAGVASTAIAVALIAAG